MSFVSKHGAEARARRHAAGPHCTVLLYFTLSCVENQHGADPATEELEDRAGAHAGVLLARCVVQCELVLPGRARRESLGAEDGARVALVDL